MSENGPATAPIITRGKTYLLVLVGSLVVVSGCAFVASYFFWINNLHRNCFYLRQAGFRVGLKSRADVSDLRAEELLDEYCPSTVFLRNTDLINPKGPLDLKQIESLSGIAPLVNDFDCPFVMIDDRAMNVFARMPKLERLRANGEQLSVASFSKLQEMKQLHCLSLSGAQISDSQIGGIEEFSHLSDLDLTGSKIGDAGLVAIAQCKNLVFLRLGGTRVTSQGIAEITKLPRLHLLDLTDTEINDSAAMHICELKTVSHINLSNTQVGDEVCRALADLPALKEVVLFTKTNVTEKGIAAIRPKIVYYWAVEKYLKSSNPAEKIPAAVHGVAAPPHK